MKCDHCKRNVDSSKAEVLYYDGKFYKGHPHCMDLLHFDLKYPRYFAKS